MVLIFVDKDSNMNMTKGALILSLSFLLAACSSIPQNIKGNNQPDIQKSFVAVHNQPGLYVGQQARFGGKVINVINGKTDTLLEISVLPLDSYAKPDIEANYQGRLLARQSGFLDPVNYRNHFVTILGTIQGEQPGFINKVPYNFLEVNMQGIQVWHLREVVKRLVLKYFELIFRHFCPCLNFIVSGECRKGFNLLITLSLEFLLIF